MIEFDVAFQNSEMTLTTSSATKVETTGEGKYTDLSVYFQDSDNTLTYTSPTCRREPRVSNFSLDFRNNEADTILLSAYDFNIMNYEEIKNFDPNQAEPLVIKLSPQNKKGDMIDFNISSPSDNTNSIILDLQNVKSISSSGKATCFEAYFEPNKNGDVAYDNESNTNLSLFTQSSATRGSSPYITMSVNAEVENYDAIRNFDPLKDKNTLHVELLAK